MFVNPDDSIGCWACVPVCPVDAIYEEEEVPGEWQYYIQKNASSLPNRRCVGSLAQVTAASVSQRQPPEGNMEESETGLRLKSSGKSDGGLKIRISKSRPTEDVRCNVSFNTGAGSWGDDSYLQRHQRNRIAATSICATGSSRSVVWYTGITW